MAVKKWIWQRRYVHTKHDSLVGLWTIQIILLNPLFQSEYSIPTNCFLNTKFKEDPSSNLAVSIPKNIPPRLPRRSVRNSTVYSLFTLLGRDRIARSAHLAKVPARFKGTDCQRLQCGEHAPTFELCTLDKNSPFVGIGILQFFEFCLLVII